MKSYEEYGYGPFAVELKESQTPIGFCGLFKRDIFQYPDLGYAFLSRFLRTKEMDLTRLRNVSHRYEIRDYPAFIL